MKILVQLSVTFLLAITVCNVLGMPNLKDSLRMERRVDGFYIIHRVEAGETLFSLSKRYSSDLAQIAKTNKLEGYAIDLGQVLEIPYTPKEEGLEEKPSRTVHKVQKGETLYAISHIYGVNIYDIKEWNELSTDDVNEGQELIVSPDKKVNNTSSSTVTVKQQGGRKDHVVKQGETVFSISKQYGISQDELRRINELESDDLSIGQVLKVSIPEVAEITEKDAGNQVAETTKEEEEIVPEKVVVEEVKETPVDSSNIRTTTFTRTTGSSENQFEKVVEEGIAMEIANSPKTEKYLCLHRSLPTGTLIQVKNLINSQSIFVRVVGKLPDTGNNEKVLIRLSNVAYQRLGAVGTRFPVEISYFPE